jgi:hypothetical protein
MKVTMTGTNHFWPRAEHPQVEVTRPPAEGDGGLEMIVPADGHPVDALHRRAH